MNITVVGQGAIGLLWYHHLRLLDEHCVSLKCSARIIEPPTKYQFTDINQQTTLHSLHIAKQAQLAQADMVIFCVKAYQVAQAYQEIKPLLPAKALVIFSHNGMGAFTAEQIKHPCMTLLTTHGAKLTAPFSVQHTGAGISDIGYFEHYPTQNMTQSSALSLASNNTAEIIKTLNQALPQVNFHHAITIKQWQKLAINCVINPLTAIDNIDNGKINLNKYSTIVRNILTEIVAVADAKNVQLNLATLVKAVKLVGESTAQNSSSMRCDIALCRPTEIEFINGYIVKMAAEHGIDTPHNKKLLRLVLQANSPKRN